MTQETTAMTNRLKDALTSLYTGTDRRAVRFRLALVAFDALTILLFVVTAPFPQSRAMEISGFVIGLAILLDLSARLWIASDRQALLKKIYTIADIVVIGSLLISPFLHQSIAFLRILRGLRLIHSYHLLNDLRRLSPFFRDREDAIIAAINLFVFVFFTTSVVFALFVEKGAGITGYVDALYFTVTTLTTTGYGDITPQTAGGKLFAVAIMVVGVALFVQLARAIFQPDKATVPCPTCGLQKHDRDAVHCKHCGEVLHIETEGM
jgi:voltage-gated potassium channel